MKKKKLIWIVMVIVIIIVAVFFVKNNDKVLKFGNNKISKTTEGLTEHILNMSSYEATAEIQVISNKNENKYVVKQQYASPNIAKQIVMEPENIASLTTTFDGKDLKIENSKLNLTQLYENYNYLTENNLFLSYFIEDYKNWEESKAQEKNGVIILETKCKEGNQYAISKKLYIDQNSTLPIKMEVQDYNQNTIVYILYNEIKINSTKKEEILAFKTVENWNDI